MPEQVFVEWTIKRRVPLKLNRDELLALYSELDNGVAKSRVAKQFGLTTTTLNRYLELRDEIEGRVNNGDG